MELVLTWSIAIRTGTSFTSDNSFLKRTTALTAACVCWIPIWTRSYRVEPSGISLESTPFIYPIPAPSPSGIGSSIWHGNSLKRDSLYFKKFCRKFDQLGNYKNTMNHIHAWKTEKPLHICFHKKKQWHVSAKHTIQKSNWHCNHKHNK